MHKKIFSMDFSTADKCRVEQYSTIWIVVIWGQHDISLQDMSMQYFRAILANETLSQNITILLKLCSSCASAQIPTED